MLRSRAYIVLLLVTLILPIPITIASNEGHDIDWSRIGIQDFIAELIEKAQKPDTPAQDKNKLLNTATSFATLYGEVLNDDGMFLKKTEERLRSLPPLPVDEKKIETSDKPAKYMEEIVEVRRQEAGLRASIKEFVTGILKQAIKRDTPGPHKEKLIELAVKLAKGYSDVWNDGGIFHSRIERMVGALPPRTDMSDDDIAREFRLAMQHGSTLTQEYLVNMIEPRIEPFIAALIEKAVAPNTNKTRKEELLTTAMNLAKTHAEMTGDSSFHQKIHRRTFTARLTEPLKSKPTDGIHVIDAPQASETIINIFRPDNIVIRNGETVRWINHDDSAHVIGTFDFLSDGHFLASRIGPNETYKYTFNKAGEYYYICYIHDSMIGKITVEEQPSR